MSARMNWRKANLSSKRSMSIVDEGEYRQSDAAARWLQKVEASKAEKKHARRRKARAR